MPIPTYEALMKPLLEAIADGQPHALKEVAEQLAERFGLTPEEREQRVSSGSKLLFYDRVGWARTYLKQAGLISSPQRGFIQLTDRGKAVLNQNPPEINDKFLMQFEEFRNFLQRSRKSREPQGLEKPADSATKPSTPTPEEQMTEAYRLLRASLTSDILDRVKNLSPQAFERLVVDVLLKLGYGGVNESEMAGQIVGGPGDEGVDGIIYQDPLGLDVIYIQAKRWNQPVGQPEVQKFVGALQGKKARKGVFITSGVFTKAAYDYVKSLDIKVILIDGERLAELMFDHGVGVSTVSSYEIKRLDNDYFDGLEGTSE